MPLWLGESTNFLETYTTYWIEAGLLEYRQALALQEQLVERRIKGDLKQDIVLALEHPPVFTLGSRGGLESLKIDPVLLQKKGIDIVETGRGGVITYHGPGQLILYPIVDLARLGMKVGLFIDRLEELMIRLSRVFGVAPSRDVRNRGVWVGDDKLGSLGIRVRKSVSFHGFALNVSTDLAPFDWIDPCGLTETRMTSLEKVSAKSIEMAPVLQETRSLYGELFGQAMETLSFNSVYAGATEDQ